MVRFLAISGAAILALGLAGATPVLLRRAPPAVVALVTPPADPAWGAQDPCGGSRIAALLREDCAVPLAWLEDGWALLSEQPGRAELRADGRRGRPATRL